MLLRIFVLTAVLFAGCIDEEDRTMQPLTLSKIPYLGNELRTDGYYYAGRSSKNVISVVVLYRDGVCFQAYAEPTGQDTIDFIKNGIFGDKTFMSRSWSNPQNIGAFHVINDSLKFDIRNPSAGGDIITLSYFHKILNDTTFVQTKFVNNATRQTFPENLTYHFKQFSPKPDSTNRFIK